MAPLTPRSGRFFLDANRSLSLFAGTHRPVHAAQDHAVTRNRRAGAPDRRTKIDPPDLEPQKLC